MEKRYQVFISSTFQDLEGARQEVSQALLRADCFPAGMELFPAADEEQFEFIKQVIQQSDYYIIISAGRYGSIHPDTGLSYTEMEYDYAVEIGKPVIRLLHKDPFSTLVGARIEKTAKGRKALEAFRKKLSGSSLVNFWEDPKELGKLVVFGLMDCRKRYPAVGWIRSDSPEFENLELENIALRQNAEPLLAELREMKSLVGSLVSAVSEAETQPQPKYVTVSSFDAAGNTQFAEKQRSTSSSSSTSISETRGSSESKGSTGSSTTKGGGISTGRSSGVTVSLPRETVSKLDALNDTVGQTHAAVLKRLLQRKFFDND